MSKVTPFPPEVPPVMFRAVTPVPYSMAAGDRPVTSKGALPLLELPSSVAVAFVVSLVSTRLIVAWPSGSVTDNADSMADNTPPEPTLTTLAPPPPLTVTGAPAVVASMFAVSSPEPEFSEEKRVDVVRHGDVVGRRVPGPLQEDIVSDSHRVNRGIQHEPALEVLKQGPPPIPVGLASRPRSTASKAEDSAAKN